MSGPSITALPTHRAGDGTRSGHIQHTAHTIVQVHTKHNIQIHMITFPDVPMYDAEKSQTKHDVSQGHSFYVGEG